MRLLNKVETHRALPSLSANLRVFTLLYFLLVFLIKIIEKFNLAYKSKFQTKFVYAGLQNIILPFNLTRHGKNDVAIAEGIIIGTY